MAYIGRQPSTTIEYSAAGQANKGGGGGGGATVSAYGAQTAGFGGGKGIVIVRY